MSNSLKLSDLSIDTLILMYGTTQIEAMLWRLDHQASTRTTIEAEFHFITDRSFPRTTFEMQKQFLKCVQTGYMDHLKKTHEQQDAIKQEIKTLRHVAESV